MFEHYGFFDLLAALKKYLLLILCVGLVFGIAGAAYVRSRSGTDDPLSDEDTLYSFSSLWLISGERGNTETDALTYNRTLAQTVCSHLNGEFAKKNIFQSLMDAYDAETLVGSVESTDDYKAETVNYVILKDYVYLDVLENSSSLMISVTCHNEALAKDVLSLYEQEEANVVSQLSGKGIDCRASLFDRADRVTASAAGAPSASDGWGTTLKYALVLAVCGVALACAAIFALTLFLPVLNRRRDVEEYGLSVLADKDESSDFAVDTVKKKAAECRSVAVCVTPDAASRAAAKKFADEAARMSGEKCRYELCVDPAHDFAAYEKVCACDGAIVFVKYGNTRHGSFAKVLSRVRGEENKLLGAVAR